VAALSATARRTFIASFLGWTLDAFDFFLIIVVVPHLATDFKHSIADVGFAVTLTLALRPVGALLFGWLADRYGRRTPLMIDIAAYSLLELLTALSPNFTVFLVLRALFGIAMGGEWGLGAALAMEALPAQRRGLFSGMLQEGYAVGNLLAGLALLLFPLIGWRGMFMLGALPAVLIFFIRAQVPESTVWLARRHERLALSGDLLWESFKRNVPLFLYAMLFMAALNFMSHGTQDSYPTFLKLQHGFDTHSVSLLNTISALGAIAGGITFGYLSQRLGRRRSIAICAVLAMLIVPLWIFSHTIASLALGGFLIQFMVQGAWGVIPAHLNEISPPLVRGTFPGFSYQVGNLIAASTLQIEATLAAKHFTTPTGAPDYARTMAVFTFVALGAVFVMALLGRFIRPEARDVAFVDPTSSSPPREAVIGAAISTPP